MTDVVLVRGAVFDGLGTELTDRRYGSPCFVALAP